MPFPLFRLPLVALTEVIKTFEIRHLFPLSMCSKRMHLVVRNLRDKSIEWKLDLKTNNFTTYLSLSVKNTSETLLDLRVTAISNPQLEGWSVDEYPGAVFQEDFFDSGFESYWEDRKNGTRCLMKHVCNLFGAKVEKVFVDQNLWLLDLVEELQGPKSYDAYCKKARRTDEQFRHLLVDLNPTSLSILSKPSKQFRIDNFNMTYDDLHVTGDWITWENLRNLDCVRLLVQKTFTVAVMNRFLRHVLLEGGAARMTEFRAQVENIDENGILDGIREVLAPIPGKMQFEDDEGSWKFSGTLARGDESVFVSIECVQDLQPTIYLCIGEEKELF